VRIVSADETDSLPERVNSLELLERATLHLIKNVFESSVHVDKMLFCLVKGERKDSGKQGGRILASLPVS
jgi:hypothetical protein